MAKGPKKQRTPLNDQELAQKIDRLIQIRPVANEYRELCGDIKDELQFRNATAFRTATGALAQLVSKPGIKWVVKLLAKLLRPAQLDLYCPRKPETRKLNQLLAATPSDKELAACSTGVPGKLELQVLAPGQAIAEEEIEEEQEEAA